jgi:2-phospho-L-lactate guanylyltransferase
MSTYAILPIKGFEQSKQRLADALSPGPRRALAEAMYADVLTSLRRCRALAGIAVVSSDHIAQRIAGGHGATVLEDPAPAAGHNAAALAGIRMALQGGIRRVLLIPGDCPLLDPRELEQLLGVRAEEERFAAIIPDRHGTGTNGLLLSPPDAIEPAFGPGSYERHQERARAAEVPHALVPVPTLALDVDTPDDLEALRAELAVRYGGAAHTRGMLKQLERSHLG